MKKNILTLCVMLLACAVRAQGGLDTVSATVDLPHYYKDHPITLCDSSQLLGHESFFYDAGYTQGPARMDLADFWFHYDSNMYMAFKFQPDTLLHVQGIAILVPDTAIAMSGGGIYRGKYTEVTLDRTIDRSPYEWLSLRLSLFHPDTGQKMHPIVQKWIPREQASYSKIYTTGRYRESGWILECLFDQEYDLTDSFYIAAEYILNPAVNHTYDRYRNPIFRGQGEVVQLWWCVCYGGGFMNYGNDGRDCPCPTVPERGLRTVKASPGGSFDDYSWKYGFSWFYPMVFPIIRCHCDSVHNLRYNRVGNSMAFIQWDSGTYNHNWQLSYGPAGSAPGADTIIECQVPRLLVSLPDPTQHYDIYVRARCQFTQDEFSDWQRLDLLLADVGTDNTASAPALDLLPNPASGQVRLHCTAQIDQVELYNPQGRIMLSQPAGSTEVLLDISHLPAGVYTTLAYTPLGVASRQLIVQ